MIVLGVASGVGELLDTEVLGLLEYDGEEILSSAVGVVIEGPSMLIDDDDVAVSKLDVEVELSEAATSSGLTTAQSSGRSCESVLTASSPSEVRQY